MLLETHWLLSIWTVAIKKMVYACIIAFTFPDYILSILSKNFFFFTLREVKWLKRFKAKRVIHLASRSLSNYWSQSGRIIWYIYFCSLDRYKDAVNKRHFYTDSIENKKKSFCSTNYLISSKWNPPRNGLPIEKC